MATTAERTRNKLQGEKIYHEAMHNKFVKRIDRQGQGSLSDDEAWTMDNHARHIDRITARLDAMKKKEVDERFANHA